MAAHWIKDRASERTSIAKVMRQLDDATARRMFRAYHSEGMPKVTDLCKRFGITGAVFEAERQRLNVPIRKGKAR